jgi:hypothetical protein
MPENPDIVSISNQPSPWQDLGNQQLFGNNEYPAQSTAFCQAPQAAHSSAEMDTGGNMSSFDGLGMGMGMDMGMGMGMGMGMNIDGLLRGNGADLPADWSQWASWDMNEREN